MSDELQNLRNDIDRLDEEILARLAERARSAQRIGVIKQGNLYRPEREAQVLRRLAAVNPGPLPGQAVQRIFREIMSACLALEHPTKVAYLGPAGTFSESAARKHFGGAAALMPTAAIDDVFRAVEAGNADYGVVPVENSTEGAVGGALDLLLANPLKICGEVNLRIHQHLLSKAEGIGAAKRLYSHAQSLAQCHEWLNRNLAHLSRVPVASNAEAARMASEDPESCAIAGEAAAELYGLNVLAANIEDDPNNTTRFVVIGDHDAGPSGQDKTSLVCSALNRPGAMHALLEPLARHGVDMTKLQSRPARGGLWEYVFYVDIDGHREDAHVAAALQELNERAAFVKVLGSYPVAAI
ncbi:prephenate dehydratase [Aromatoleum petrolei]|uniref:Bifunctional chorismate mutase/prephenate dehydratase n=1 Tax=Aromatoleum petrolei TaxID=76116 RepID=A0ABX1MVQ0_9RHOO|nr:prephenate dehydratase [Aromatoleum petrolei]NMF90420.1 prephenate dehydratase [Aromatoleum petrolei]QTQ35686.1 Bifunctional P-protein, chorismate mutase/prephenate dehydratase [Aromatoleum petrolei]